MLVKNGDLISPEKEINICYNCQNYNLISQICSHKQKQMHETQGCELFNIDIDKEFKTLNEVREEHELKVLQNNIYNLILQKKKDVATELMVKEFKERNHIKVTRDDLKPEFYIYNKGIYEPEGRTYIEEFCRKVLAEAYNTKFLNDITAKIQADCKVGFEEFLNQNYENELPVQNGILDLKKNCLKPFTPEKYFFNKIPIYYDITAECPKIKQFLKDITKSDDDVNLIIEIFGFSLIKKMLLERAFMFVGDGGNGKSQLLDLFKQFIGMKNICSVNLQQMKSEDSGIPEMHNKLVNLAGDLNNNSLKETGLFKELSSGDPVQAKRKYKRDIIFKNHAKMIFACNELPRVYDYSKGFWRRWILINFPYEFVDNKFYNSLNLKERLNKKIKEPKIVEKILSDEELSGLLNLALEGLKTIIKNKSFTYSDSAEEVKSSWVRKADSFVAFCMDYLEEDYEGRISKRELRSYYHSYRREHKLKSVSDKSIKRTLEEEFGINETADNGIWSWEGIKFKQVQK